MSVSPGNVSASYCAKEAWRITWAYPAPFLFGGFLLIAVSIGVPLIGTLIAGPMWVGLCAMSLKAQAGQEPTVADFFAPMGDARATASWIFGLVITAILTIASMVGMALVMGSFLGLLAAARGGAIASPGAFVLGTTGGCAVMLLPLVPIAYYVLPAGFYIAHGGTDCFAAIRRSASQVFRRRGFWSAFWGIMMLGHLAGMLACCVGLIVIFPWNAIAIGVGLAGSDPTLLEQAPPPIR